VSHGQLIVRLFNPIQANKLRQEFFYRRRHLLKQPRNNLPLTETSELIPCTKTVPALSHMNPVHTLPPATNLFMSNATLSSDLSLHLPNCLFPSGNKQTHMDQNQIRPRSSSANKITEFHRTPPSVLEV
jgi:hypothetical protein